MERIVTGENFVWCLLGAHVAAFLLILVAGVFWPRSKP